LSCRKNATIYDRRLPGGAAAGKITSYYMEVDGSSTSMRGGVSIGCSIGASTAVLPEDGDPVYAEAGYAEPGWQMYEDAIIVLPDTADMAYTPPVPFTIDDGLTVPLTREDAIESQSVVGSVDVQYAAMNFEIAETIRQAKSSGNEDGQQQQIPEGAQGWVVTVSGQKDKGEAYSKAAKEAVDKAVNDNPYYYDIKFPNVQNGPFNANYSLTVTPATLPRQIDLEADAP
jgi:hypothetical protein